MGEASSGDMWDVLRRAGVPIGHHVAGRSPTSNELRAALSSVIASEIDPRSRDALGAWLGALRRHWPTRYATIACGMTQELDDIVRAVDPNRYLKLRRIASAHLAGTLPR